MSHVAQENLSASPFISTLKQETSAMHRMIEQDSFFDRMGKGEISKEQYIHYLKCMRRVNRMIENLLQDSPSEVGQIARQLGFPLSSLVEKDLEFFGSETRDELPQEEGEGLVFAVQQVQSQARSNRSNLLGFIYLIGGSQHGAAFIAKALQKSGLIGSDFEGGHYLKGIGLAPLAERWPHFLASLQEYVRQNVHLQSEIITTVQIGYEMMRRIGRGIVKQEEMKSC